MNIPITYKGCKLAIPNFCASAPVAKGSKAEPIIPVPAMIPSDPGRSTGGIRLPETFMSMGYIGPRKNPTKDTATAFTVRDGTTYTIICRLYTG